ncbi:MAG: vgr related protein [Sphingomonadales bacterium]|nr:vgr related protein [Sphingomonadales bacterium]
MTTRPLTPGETALTGAVFGTAIDCAPVRIHRRRWWPLQPCHIVMAPCGHLHFAPGSPDYRDDFAAADPALQGLFIHEMTHVWQAQARGRFYLPFHRHPFCRYRYRLVPGKPFAAYGIEQQAEIVRHAFLARIGSRPTPPGDAEALERLLPFRGA